MPIPAQLKTEEKMELGCIRQQSRADLRRATMILHRPPARAHDFNFYSFIAPPLNLKCVMRIDISKKAEKT